MSKILRKSLSGILVLGALALTACNQNPTNPNTIQRAPGPTIPNNPNNPNSPGGLQASGWGMILNPSLPDLQKLTSASGTSQLGNVGPNIQGTGVYFKGFLNLVGQNAQALATGQANGQLDPSSSFVIEIWDDIAVNGGAQPYQIAISPSNGQASGTVQAGHVEAVFQDSYGQIGVSGQISGQTVNVILSYWNSNGAGAQTGTLGQGTIPLCSLFRCQ